jgi:fructose-bisphosphate aldolase class 1
VGVENTETNRRDWRELLYTAPGLGKSVAGCIMFEETLYQKAADGRQFVDILLDAGIYPGIKVDTGLQVGELGLFYAETKKGGTRRKRLSVERSRRRRRRRRRRGGGASGLLGE